jgi:hypothetical protein
MMEQIIAFLAAGAIIALVMKLQFISHDRLEQRRRAEVQARIDQEITRKRNYLEAHPDEMSWVFWLSRDGEWNSSAWGA